MGEHLTLERYYWFDNQVRANYFPNATILAERFEISPKTAQRSIEFMRDRFLAPLEYQPSRRGYCYTDKSFALPAFRVSREELVSILIARDLLTNSAGGAISKTIRSFGRKLAATMGEIGFTEEKLHDAFSAVWNGHSPSRAETLKTLDGFLKGLGYVKEVP